jgi:hypothetical protein
MTRVNRLMEQIAGHPEDSGTGAANSYAEPMAHGSAAAPADRVSKRRRTQR